MPNFPCEARPAPVPAVLTVRELESRLGQLSRGEVTPELFWHDNLMPFRQTLAVAVEETVGLLKRPAADRWRAELEAQLECLLGYVQIVDVHIRDVEQAAKALPN